MQLAGILLLLVATDGSNTLGAEYDVDFRGGKFDNQQLRLVGSGAARLVRPGPSGLVIGIPRGAGMSEIGFAPKCVVHGDFEITASYEIVEVSEPDGGYGVGPGIHIATASKAEHAATLSRLRRVKEGDVYGAHVAWFAEGKTEARKREHRVRVFSTNADSGRLRLVRSGKTLEYLVADGGSETFRRLYQVPFADAKVELVRVALHRNGAQTPAVVLWKEFSLRAERISGLPPPSLAKGWFFWAMIALVGVVMAAGAWYWWRVRSA